ncbi:hypothetical protein GLOTRDRAFT_120866 [Gloeophyllum trabeum ATCC 11539]|uniref:Transcription factor BYE1 n=1 Tax=Gloeophyllum trabeum (strain ATCC 11539 / FP-39264 / Madison 617) TaxID=670483 RepID=S7Q9W7_GLOTA|nr:uncharacterized protein GLOTRDRAFT_120866 [Gloeophyllum trabeum ATCC 11539]EPQ56312.1 hypothetical protein GLOTRDRAFT_120866 [Gloeophyllum trabeum ATCC 11539]
MPVRLPRKADLSTPAKKGRTQDDTDTEKENTKAPKGKVKNARPKKVVNGKGKRAYCTCRGPDDGTPMVACAECDEWYHFRCVDLDERDAEDLAVYICPSCQQRTGRRSVMEWEGSEALEEAKVQESPTVQSKKKRTRSRPPEDDSEPSEKEASDFESDGSGDDEYVEDVGRRGSKGNAKKRVVHISSESESGDEHNHVRSRRRASTVSGRRKSASPHPSAHLKRKGSSAVQSPAPKRKKSDNSNAEDPARKYCLGKYEEMFCQIFAKFPHLPNDEDGNHDVEKDPQELTPEEKALVEDKAKQFAAELERCIFDTYAEPGHQGRPVAGAKYKERFRMLTFNLSKPDRVTLHKNIASSRITPKDLSLMSSTDLANEELKQSIKIAEQEALEHSILQKTSAPRAKITHKGLQDIEDVHGETTSQRIERERAREQLEEEKRERERLARLKAAQRGSVPPESPVTPQSASWGGPPPVPQHAMHGEPSTHFGSMRPPANPLFIPTPSEMNTPVVNELNLADLINLDEETSSPTNEPPPTPFEADLSLVSSETKVDGQPEHEASPVQPTGISPFAAGVSRPDPTARTSFDLNSFWSSGDQEKPHTPPRTPTPPPAAQDDQRDINMEAAEGQGAEDEDFDMFLERDDEASKGESNNFQPNILPIEKQPQVFTGAVSTPSIPRLSMPIDDVVPQNTPVVAYQMGGRSIPSTSPLWRTLFPSSELRIDGRVAVDKSSQFLLQMRMNATKELIAVAFAPIAGTEHLLRKLSDYLRTKNRHGLIFPWGHHPKDHHPGRELYIIPLLATEPIPEYMELLDELRLPKLRDADYLVGIWVLNKGKLAPPPTPQAAPVPPQQASAQPVQPSSSFQPPAGSPPNNVSLPVPISAPAPALAPAVPSVTPVPAVPSNPVSPPIVNPSAVAAELATLTPEQIQLMLQTLSTSGLVPPVNVPLAPPSVPVQRPIPSLTSQSPPWPVAPPGPGYVSGYPQNSPSGSVTLEEGRPGTGMSVDGAGALEAAVEAEVDAVEEEKAGIESMIGTAGLRIQGGQDVVVEARGKVLHEVSWIVFYLSSLLLSMYELYCISTVH